MSVSTANAYGRISITEEAIAQVAGNTTLDCYGVVELYPKNIFRRIAGLFKFSKPSLGVKVKTAGDRISIILFINLKYGVAIEAVAQSLVKSVKYDVEKFTGMLVDNVDINVFKVKI